MPGTESKSKDPRPKTQDDVAAIVLAAGRSRRMGRFKPLLPFGNKTVIQSCIDNYRDAGVEEIVIVLGHRAAEVTEHLKTSSVAFVTNPEPDSEMSRSVALGVAALSSNAKGVLITPADHPAVPANVIRTIIERWRGGSQLIQPEFERRGGHPVIIDLDYRDELTTLDQHEGLRGFFAKHRQEVLRLPVDCPFVAQDMDTWDDYLRLHEAVFGHKPKYSAPTEDPNG